MKPASVLLALALVAFPAAGSGLPRWADAAVDESAREPAPVRSGAWILLDRTEYLYAGGGEIQVHRRRVVKILTADGRRQGSFQLWGMGGQGYRVKKVEGWNLPPGAKVLTLDKENAYTEDADAENELSDHFLTGITLPDVVPGSIVAFESVEVLTPAMGPSARVFCMDRDPVLRWELEADTRWYVPAGVTTTLEPFQVETWSREVETLPGRGLRIRHLPGLEEARGLPGSVASLPSVTLGFEDPKAPRRFEGPAKAFGAAGFAMLDPAGPIPAGIPVFAGDPAARLEALAAWMRGTCSYRQVYLTAERGWQPLPPEKTLRQHAGDCKDLAAVAISAARKAGFQAFPVLAHIGDGVARRQEPVPTGLFNHAIAAIRLPEGVAFPAAVPVAGARYLLFDPTSHSTPLGYLPGAHRGGQVFLCFPDGGAWADVPAGAILPGRVEVVVDGEVDPAGRFQGTLTVRDQDGLRLTDVAGQGGVPALRAYLGRLLDLDAASDLIVLASSAPATPGVFTLKAKVDLAGVVQVRGSRLALALPGLPPAPAPVQRTGVPRRVGVKVGSDLQWSWRAKVKAPAGWEPVLANLDRSTGLRTLRWSGKVGEGGVLDLALDMTTSPAEWSAAQAAEGVAAVDRDRLGFRAFLASILTFRKP